MGNVLAMGERDFPPPVVMGSADLMSPKAHGTCTSGVPQTSGALRWAVDAKMADRVCCFNRHYAEPSGYFEGSSAFLDDVRAATPDAPLTFYDPVKRKPLFVAPQGRTAAEFIKESESHGWPSFRDAEVVWENVRVLRDGEAVTVDGVHLGHNLPDAKGNRYCINLVSVAGVPPSPDAAQTRAEEQ